MEHKIKKPRRESLPFKIALIYVAMESLMIFCTFIIELPVSERMGQILFDVFLPTSVITAFVLYAAPEEYRFIWFLITQVSIFFMIWGIFKLFFWLMKRTTGDLNK